MVVAGRLVVSSEILHKCFSGSRWASWWDRKDSESPTNRRSWAHSDRRRTLMTNPRQELRPSLVEYSLNSHPDATLCSSRRTCDSAVASRPAGTETIPSPHISITNVNSFPPAVTGYTSP